MANWRTNLIRMMHHAVQTLTGAGAVTLTEPVTQVVTTGADALTLADGELNQVKYIGMLTDGGDGTLTPTNLKNYTTITFNDPGDYVVLQFNGLKWEILMYEGVTLG